MDHNRRKGRPHSVPPILYSFFLVIHSQTECRQMVLETHVEVKAQDEFWEVCNTIDAHAGGPQLAASSPIPPTYNEIT